MLATNLMSANDLGLNQIQRDALIKVLGMLERNEILHAILEKIDDDDLKDDAFNMAYWSEAHGCGTVRCIGGWAEHIGGFRFGRATARMRRTLNDALSKLFYADGYHGEMEDITLEQAAVALRNYLTTGDAKWEELAK